MKSKFETFKNRIEEAQEPLHPLQQRIIMCEYQSPELIDKLVDGFRQLIKGKGYSKDNPLENIGVDGFYFLMDVFHYVVITQGLTKSTTDFNLDVMIVQDVVTMDRVILYNRVNVE